MNKESVNKVDINLLQQQNFKEILQEMSGVDGWETLENSDLLALKAPSAINFVNFVWGVSSQENIIKVKSFYGNAKFSWITNIEDDVNNLTGSGFILDYDNFPEMVLNLDEYQIPYTNPNIKTTIPQTKVELDLWAITASKTFGCSDDEFKEFFYPLVNFGNCIPVLVMYHEKPAGTAMIYCGKNSAGIYAMSTLEEYRRKGCGMVAVNACVKLAKSHDLNKIVLHSSKLGEKLYKKNGFKETHRLQEWHLSEI